MMKTLLKMVVLLIFSASMISAQTKPFDFAELEQTIEAELKTAKTPGAAFAVISGDKVVFSKGFGTTSAESGNTGVTPDTLFRMGSTTKMFTAAALLALADRGKIKLDAPIGTYLKDLPARVSQLTAHQILSQSSGLRDFAAPVKSDDDAGLKQNILSWKDDVFFTEPNKIYSYSSANYWLAGFLTEEISGKFYADAVADFVLKPLGMNKSTMRPLEAATHPLALGHNISDQKAAVVIRPIFNNAAMYPGGSMYSSANELARFAAALMNGGKIEGRQALAPFVVENLQKPQFFLPGEEKAFYGYGLLGYEDSGVKTVSHGGVSRGYGSTIFFAPEQKIAVIVLANSNGQTLPKSRRKAMEMFLPLKTPPTPQNAEAVVNTAELKRYAGTFSHAPQLWEFFIKDAKLFLKQDGKEFELKKTGKDTFGFEEGEFLFVRNDKGEFEHIFMGLYAARRVLN